MKNVYLLIFCIFLNGEKCQEGKCNKITNQEECKYAQDEGTLIECKWNGFVPEGKKCQVDGYREIQYCSTARGEIDMTNELCSKLKVITEGNYCRKGPDGCIEFGDCPSTIDVEVEPNICKELTKPDDKLQCIPSENGCTMGKVKCLNNSLYIYDKIKCEKLDISS